MWYLLYRLLPRRKDTRLIAGGKGPCKVNPDLWYTELPQGKPTINTVSATAEKVKLAISICNDCPAKWKCEEEGMKPENLLHGIWGGMMAGERLIESGAKMQDYSKDSDEWKAITFALRMIPWVRW